MSDKNNNVADKKNALDDIMIAMDVVDTLRHDKRLIDRELNDDKRREDLIKKLRELYQSQGIDVPDHVLEEGVQALEDERFVYQPPKESYKTWLAKLYVSRDSWGKNLSIGLAVVLGVWLFWHFTVERPKDLKTQQTEQELTTRLPKSIQSLVSDIKTESQNPSISLTAHQIGESGLRAAKSKDLSATQKAERDLQEMLQILRQEYTIKIVNRKGQGSILSRIPKVNKSKRNYYLIVEAVDKKGNIVPKTILNEETGKRKETKFWAIRVPKKTFDTVKADKKDDGIIQNNRVAIKKRGYVAPQLLMQTSGGSITSW